MTAAWPQTLVLLVMALPVMAAATDREPFGLLTIDEVAADVGKAGVYLLDANTREVFEAGHLPGAKLVPFKVNASDLPADRSAKLIFYCQNPH